MFSLQLRPGLSILAGLALLAPTSSATAGPPPDGCERTGSLVFVGMTTAPGQMFVDDGGILVVLFGGSEQNCDGASNDNTTFIAVQGTDAKDNFLVDQSGAGGPFRPEISWSVDLGVGDDLFRFRGTPQADRIYIGTWQQGNNVVDVVDTDGDGQPNIDMNEVERFERAPSRGNDRVSGTFPGGANRGGTTMGPARLPLTLKGGPGKDKLTGGLENDTLVGGTSNDTLKGGKGKDAMKGGGGEDQCNGGPGKDKERGCE